MLQMVKHIFLFIITGILLCGCNNLDIKGLFVPTGDGVDSRFEQSKAMYADLKAGVIETAGSYVFYVAADPHIDKTTRNLDIFNDTFRNDSDASFGVILGDCTDVKDNLKNYLKALAYYPERHSSDHKIFHVLGNHDIYFKGWDDFKNSIGPSTYWFEVVFPEGKDLYISLDTATGTLGSKQTKWFREFIEMNRSSYRHCIILTHTNFFYTDMSQDSSGNMPIEESFSLIDFLGSHDASLVLQGHDHYREDISYMNVRFTVLGSISDKSDSPEYLRVKGTPEGMCLEWNILDPINVD